MARTQKNKATSKHLGMLKAKLAKLKQEVLTGHKVRITFSCNRWEHTCYFHLRCTTQSTTRRWWRWRRFRRDQGKQYLYMMYSKPHITLRTSHSLVIQELVLLVFHRWASPRFLPSSQELRQKRLLTSLRHWHAFQACSSIRLHFIPDSFPALYHRPRYMNKQTDRLVDRQADNEKKLLSIWSQTSENRNG